MFYIYLRSHTHCLLYIFEITHTLSSIYICDRSHTALNPSKNTHTRVLFNSIYSILVSVGSHVMHAVYALTNICVQIFVDSTYAIYTHAMKIQKEILVYFEPMTSRKRRWIQKPLLNPSLNLAPKTLHPNPTPSPSTAPNPTQAPLSNVSWASQIQISVNPHPTINKPSSNHQ